MFLTLCARLSSMLQSISGEHHAVEGESHEPCATLRWCPSSQPPYQGRAAQSQSTGSCGDGTRQHRHGQCRYQACGRPVGPSKDGELRAQFHGAQEQRREWPGVGRLKCSFETSGRRRPISARGCLPVVVLPCTCPEHRVRHRGFPSTLYCAAPLTSRS